MSSVVIVARDQAKPGSLLARPKDVKMRDPGNEVAVLQALGFHGDGRFRYRVVTVIQK